MQSTMSYIKPNTQYTFHVIHIIVVSLDNNLLWVKIIQ